MPLAVGLFLFFAALAHYWRFRLPGGTYLAALPALQTARYRRNHLDEISGGVELRRLLAKRNMRFRLERKLARPQIDELDARLVDLGDAIQSATRAGANRASFGDEAHRTGTSGTHFSPRRMARPGNPGRDVRSILRTNERLSVVPRAQRIHVATLQPGDHVGGNKLAYGSRLPWSAHVRSSSPPRRGDVVVFQRVLPGANAPEPLVKRVIGLPGDRIMMYAGFPIINGWKVPSCYAGPYSTSGPTASPSPAGSASSISKTKPT